MKYYKVDFLFVVLFHLTIMSKDSRTEYRQKVERSIIKKILHKEVFLDTKTRDINHIRGVTSPTQTSKTRWIIAQALIAVTEGRSAILVPRNFQGDEIQLIKRLKTVEEIMQYEMKKKGFKYKINFITSGRNDATKRSESFRDGNTLIISLANSTQLRRVIKASKLYPGSYDLFIDEADASDYGKETKTQEDVKRAIAFDTLKRGSYRTFCISATLMGVVLNEPTMRAKDLIRLIPPKDYRGFKDIASNINILKFRVHGFNRARKWDSWVESDPNLLPFLTEFSQRDAHVIGAGYATGIKLHPQICLLNVTMSMKSHEEIVKGIANDNLLGKKLVVIGMNGNGIALHIPGKEVIQYTKALTVTPCKFTKAKGFTLTNVLQYIYDLNNADNPEHEDLERPLLLPRIVVVSGKCVGRGISVVSRDYNYHCPTMYFTPSATMSIPNLIQAMGRLCGRNRGKAMLELHATTDVWDCLHRGLLSEDELLTRATQFPSLSLADSIRNIPINRCKIPPARRSLTKGKDNVRNTLNLVSGEDGGLEFKDYLLVDSASELPITLTGSLEKMFEKWCKPNNNTKIARTARAIDPSVIYDIKEWPKPFVRANDITISEKTINSNQHKPFMLKQSGLLCVHPNLVELFSRYFMK